jgi:plasmid stability protein
MATVEIRNLNDEAYAILRRRAAASGRSLQEFPRTHLEEEALPPTIDEALGAARAELTSSFSTNDSLAAQSEGRGE